MLEQSWLDVRCEASVLFYSKWLVSSPDSVPWLSHLFLAALQSYLYLALNSHLYLGLFLAFPFSSIDLSVLGYKFSDDLTWFKDKTYTLAEWMSFTQPSINNNSFNRAFLSLLIRDRNSRGSHISWQGPECHYSGLLLIEGRVISQIDSGIDIFVWKRKSQSELSPHSYRTSCQSLNSQRSFRPLHVHLSTSGPHFLLSPSLLLNSKRALLHISAQVSPCPGNLSWGSSLRPTLATSAPALNTTESTCR